MSAHINGIIFEQKVVDALNNKKYKELSNNMRSIIDTIYPNIKPREFITCRLTQDFIKPDIIISIKKHESAYVSLKHGASTVMHSESIKEFVLFLRSLGVSTRAQKILLLYHYGDGTMDGSGKIRKDYHETYQWLEKDIQEFNEEINSNPDLVEAILDRLIFQGVNSKATSATHIYQGDMSYGTTVSKLQIYKHLKRKKYDFYENMHIGPLLIKAHARYSHKEIVDPKRREKVEFYWPKFESDIKYIATRYDQDFLE